MNKGFTKLESLSNYDDDFYFSSQFNQETNEFLILGKNDNFLFGKKNVIFVSKSGVNLYGNANEKSDFWIFVVYVPESRDVVLDNAQKTMSNEEECFGERKLRVIYVDVYTYMNLLLDSDFTCVESIFAENVIAEFNNKLISKIKNMFSQINERSYKQFFNRLTTYSDNNYSYLKDHENFAKAILAEIEQLITKGTIEYPLKNLPDKVPDFEEIKRLRNAYNEQFYSRIISPIFKINDRTTIVNNFKLDIFKENFLKEIGVKTKH